MSRAPLLRSSTAEGTGSYGILPDQISAALQHSTKTLSEKRSGSRLRKHGSTLFQKKQDMRPRASIGEGISRAYYKWSSVEDDIDRGSELTILQEALDEVGRERTECGRADTTESEPDIPLVGSLYKTTSHASSSGYERPDAQIPEDDTNTPDEDEAHASSRLHDEDPSDNSPYP